MSSHRTLLLFALCWIAPFSAGCGQSASSATSNVVALGQDIDNLEAELERHAADVTNAAKLASLGPLEDEHLQRAESIMNSMLATMDGLSSCMDDHGGMLQTNDMRATMQGMHDECLRHWDAEQATSDMMSAHSEEDMHQNTMSDMMTMMHGMYGSMQDKMDSYQCDHCTHCSNR